MNTLYNLALRQSSSIQSELALVESTPASSSSYTSLSGQLSASLAALGRTVDDYENMAKRELNVPKREKALQRVKKFRDEEREYRMSFQSIKSRGSEASSSTNGSGFAGPSSGQSSSLSSGVGLSNAESPFSLHARTQTQHAGGQGRAGTPTQFNGQPMHQQPQMHSALPPQDRPDPLSAYRMNASAAAMFGGGGMGSADGTGGTTAREGFALREHSFIDQTENQLDSFIAQGREVWQNLTEQRDILKGTQRKLRDVGVTLGLSRNVIGYIERRSTQDNIIFAAGALFTLVCFFYIYKWFG